jgi:hypothetical chaperone protein
MRSLKSLLGSSLIDGRTEVNGSVIVFRDLLTQFIATVKARAEAQAGRSFEQAVLGRPVFFVDDIRRLIASPKNAGRYRPRRRLQGGELPVRADCRRLSIRNAPWPVKKSCWSPISAAAPRTFSIVRLSPQRAKASERWSDVLANGGVHIGGTDFDKQAESGGVHALARLSQPLKNGRELPAGIYFNLATWHTINFAYTRAVWAEQQRLAVDAMEPECLSRLLALIQERAGHWLAHQVEQAKIAGSPWSRGIPEAYPACRTITKAE